MASNSFGKLFRFTTWGESHGKSIGVVIDGCPAGLELNEQDINVELSKRSPGNNPLVSKRKEPDHAVIASGVFEGKTTGAPLSLIIANHDADSSSYEPIKHLLRPGHANYTYQTKYGVFDYRGGGRASARETACRVAAGAIAKKFLQKYNIFPIAYIKELGGIEAHLNYEHVHEFPKLIAKSAVYCPDIHASKKMASLIEEIREQGDSLGGVVEFYVDGMPAGLGDPVYDKLEALLASSMMSIPASKGFEIGSGFQAARMKGSQHNDIYILEDNKVRTQTNHSGGVLGGISNGMPLIARVAFKPTSSIMQKQPTIDMEGHTAALQLPVGSRHDPCLTIRAVPVVEAMVALVLTDTILLNWSARVD